MKPASHRSLTLVLQSVQVHLKDFMFQEAGVCRTCSSVPWVVPFPEGLALPSGGSLYLHTVSAHRTDNTDCFTYQQQNEESGGNQDPK